MGRRLTQAGHWIVNAAIVVVAICFVILTVSKIRENRSNSVLRRLQVGDPVSLPHDLRGQPVLLIALQVGCHFCEESMPFYKSISDESGSLGAHLVFVFPRSLDTGRSVLSGHGVAAQDVRQVDFANLGVNGTPTVLLLSPQGRVQDVWVGKLDDSREKQIQEAILQPHS